MALLMGIFYKAERKAFMPHIVRKSFADVGLWPWNADLILENCLKFCPVDSQQEEDETMRDLIDAVNIHRQRQKEWFGGGKRHRCERIMILSFSGKKKTLKIW